MQGKLRGSETDAMFKDKYIKYETVFFKHNANSQMQVYSEKLTGSNEGYTLQVKKQIYEMVTCNNGKTSSEKKLMLCLERESNPRPSVSCPNVIPLHYTSLELKLNWVTHVSISYISLRGLCCQQGCLDSVVVSHSDMKPRDVGSIPARGITSIFLKEEVFPLLQVTIVNFFDNFKDR